MAEEVTQLFTGKVFYNPGTGIFTQFFPMGGLNPEGEWTPASLNPDGSVVIAPETVEIADVRAVPASVTPVEAAAPNPNRKGLICYNNSSSVCYIAYADTVTNQLFTEFLEPGSTFSMDTPIYTGAISAVWDSANGQLQVTEL